MRPFASFAVILAFLAVSDVQAQVAPSAPQQPQPPSAVAAPAAPNSSASTKTWHEALVPFAWPAVALFALLLFRSQLIELLAALARNMQTARVKMLGVEFEMTHIQNTEQFKGYSSNLGDKPEISGDPDKFQLLMKASNTRLSKSTKVMNLENGCLFQVSTREILKDQSIALAEALAFVPDLNVMLEKSYEYRTPDKDEKVKAKFIRINEAS